MRFGCLRTITGKWPAREALDTALDGTGDCSLLFPWVLGQLPSLLDCLDCRSPAPQAAGRLSCGGQAGRAGRAGDLLLL